MTQTLSRDVAVVAKETALLFVDVQNFCANRKGSEYGKLPAPEFEERVGFYFREMEERVIPNMQRLQKGCRAAGIEVMYTTIESLTKDGRDRSLDYKISGFHVPKGSWDGKVIDAIKPGEDEIYIPKTSSSVFMSTNIDYVLRNLGTRYLVISGVVIDAYLDQRSRASASNLPRLSRRLPPELVADNTAGDQKSMPLLRPEQPLCNNGAWYGSQEWYVEGDRARRRLPQFLTGRCF